MSHDDSEWKDQVMGPPQGDLDEDEAYQPPPSPDTTTPVSARPAKIKQPRAPRPKRQMPVAVKRSYSFYRDVLKLTDPFAGLINCSIAVTLVIWHIGFSPVYSFVGAGVGVGFVLFELALFAVVDKLYRRSRPDDMTNLVLIILVSVIMLGTAGYLVLKQLEWVPSTLLVVAFFMSFPGILVFLADKMKRRANQEADEAKRQMQVDEIGEMLDAFRVVFGDLNQVIPGMNEAISGANRTVEASQSLLGVLTNQEAYLDRQVEARLKVEKPAQVEQLRGEFQTKLDEAIAAERARHEQELAQVRRSTAASPVQSATSLPSYPGPQSGGDVPPSQMTVPSEVTGHS